MRGGVFPLRVGGREVLADVAIGNSAEDGIRQRVEADIGVGMALQALRMRDPDPAQPDMIARYQAMNVIARARPHVRIAGLWDTDEALGQVEILRITHLEIALAPAHDGDVQT